MTSPKSAALENGVHIPLLGSTLTDTDPHQIMTFTFFHTVGTYKLRDPAIIMSVTDAALANGYRLIGKLPIHTYW